MENLQQTTPVETPELKGKFADEVKNFYQDDFVDLFMTFIKNPIDGLYSIFEKPSHKAYIHSLILFASVFILCLLGSYIMAGEGRNFMEFSDFIKISLIPVIFMFFITVLSFLIKSVSGKPNFKNELQTGGLCGVPIGILIVASIFVKIFISTDNMYMVIQNPTRGGVIGLTLAFYILLMLINVFQQSLKASKTKSNIAWYLSPASILLAMYLTSQIAKSLF